MKLSQAILALAPPFIARARAPSSWPELLATRDAAARPVWDGALDRTIWQPEINLAFRAWHDATHLAINADFSLAGEIRTCEAQISALHNTFGRAPAWCDDILRLEVIGQAEHFERTGQFIQNQLDWARARWHATSWNYLQGAL